MEGDLVVEFSFIKQGVIYKTRNRGIGSVLPGMLGMRGMFTMILGNLLRFLENVFILEFRRVLEKIPGYFREDSEGCSRRLRGMFQEILWNVIKDFGQVY